MADYAYSTAYGEGKQSAYNRLLAFLYHEMAVVVDADTVYNDLALQFFLAQTIQLPEVAARGVELKAA